MKFDRHLGSTAAEVPVKLPSDCKSLNPNLADSRLHKILRSYCLVNKRPRVGILFVFDSFQAPHLTYIEIEHICIWLFVFGGKGIFDPNSARDLPQKPGRYQKSDLNFCTL